MAARSDWGRARLSPTLLKALSSNPSRSKANLPAPARTAASSTPIAIRRPGRCLAGRFDAFGADGERAPLRGVLGPALWAAPWLGPWLGLLGRAGSVGAAPADGMAPLGAARNCVPGIQSGAPS